MSLSKPRPLECSDCGQLVVKRPRYDRIIRCPECAALRIADCARQMANKSGPVWDAWLSSNADGAPGASHSQGE